MQQLISAITSKVAVRGEGIRVGVKTSGCSGLAYVLEFVDEVDTHDQVFEQFGVKVFVDPKVWYLEGLEMDYVLEQASNYIKIKRRMWLW